MTKNNPTPTIEEMLKDGELRFRRAIDGSGVDEPYEFTRWLRTVLTTIDQNARKNTLEEVRRWFGSDYDPTSYDWIVQRLDHALSHPLNK